MESYEDQEESSSFIVGLIFAAIETSLNVFLMMSVGVLLAQPRIGLVTKSNLKGIAQIWLKVVLPVFLFNKFASFSSEVIFESYTAILFSLAMIVIQVLVGAVLFTDWSGLLFKKKSIEEGKKKRPSFVPRNIFLLVVSFQSAIVLPYPYVVSFTESDAIFKHTDRQELAQTYLAMAAFPVLLVYFSFGVWWGKREGKRKEAYDKKHGLYVKVEKEEEVKNESFIKKVYNKIKCILGIFPNSVYAMLFGLVFTFIEPLKDVVFTNPAPVVAVIGKVVGVWAKAMPPLAYLIIGGNVGFLLSKKKKEETEDEVVSVEQEEEEGTEEEMTDITSDLDSTDIGDSTDKEEEEGGQEVSDAGEKVQTKKRNKKSWNPLSLIFRFNQPYHLIAGVAGKMVIIPLIYFVLIVAIGTFLPNLLMEDPMSRPIFYTVLMIEGCVPCMLASIVIANAAGAGVDEVSEVVLWQYLVSPVLTVFYGIIFIYTFCSMEEGACKM